MNNLITNPILPGFNPDPSICRVGDDYYIATSTFEWYPGVQIHHSRDMKNWRLVSRPLNRAALLDMTGEPDSCGVWAPCLTHHEGRFYLCYTDVKRFDGNFKDTHNYLTSCETIDGDWSDPIYLNSSGFDPSLFVDDDGSQWIVNMVWDHRTDRTFFYGIVLQQLSLQEKKLVGPIKTLFKGSELGFTEGPHLYKRNGYYYLLTAEGGTGYNHAMTMARSKNLDGPYEVDPINHFLTAKDTPENGIQRAGHGDFVETQNGDWYAVHLCSRPLSTVGCEQRCSPMGRETALQKVYWNNEGWLRVAETDPTPSVSLPPSQLPEHPWPFESTRHEFDTEELPDCFQWLRVPDTSSWMSLADRTGYLRLYGQESLGSWFRSSLIARRQEHFCYDAITALEFEPDHFQQMAGLVAYYNSHKFHYCFVGFDEVEGRYLGIMSCEGDQSLAVSFPLEGKKCRVPRGQIHLKAEVRFDRLVFHWSVDGMTWTELPTELDYSLLSDEAGKGDGANFTGTFIGMACQDSSGQHRPADFSYFDYQPLGNT